MVPLVHSATCMLPYPWSTLARVVLVEFDSADLVVLNDFHAQVLHATGPMAVSLDVLRARLGRTQGTQLVCDQANNPMVLAALKEAQVLGPKVARTKLIALPTLERALITAGKRPDHVALIMNTYKNAKGPGGAHPQAASAQLPTPQGTPHGGLARMPVLHPHPPSPPSELGGSSALASLGTALAKRRSPHEGDPQEEAPSQGMWARDWPTTLPELAFPPKALAQDYSLAALLPTYRQDATIPLGQELDLFKEWCMAPVHLGRGVQYPAPVATITYQGCEDTILGFCGFMLKVRSHSVLWVSVCCEWIDPAQGSIHPLLTWRD